MYKNEKGNSIEVNEKKQKIILKSQQQPIMNEKINTRVKMKDELEEQSNTSDLQKDEQIQQSSEGEQNLDEIRYKDVINSPYPKDSFKSSIRQGNKNSNENQQYKRNNDKKFKTNIYQDNKLLIQSNLKIKKPIQPFYEQTFYITGVKQNFLLLLSDSNQVLQFPIGIFQAQNQSISNFDGQSEQDSIDNAKISLMKDIKIGQPIKIKLQVDYQRQEKDKLKFNRLQQSLNKGNP